MFTIDYVPKIGREARKIEVGSKQTHNHNYQLLFCMSRLKYRQKKGYFQGKKGYFHA